MPARLWNPQTDGVAVRGIWNATAQAIGSLYPEGFDAFTSDAAGLSRLRAMNAIGEHRVWEDGTLTIHGYLWTRRAEIRGDTLAEEAVCLFPRPSVSRALFRQVCRELLEHWFNACIARRTKLCWGKFPVATPVLMRKVFDDMAAQNGAVTDATLNPPHLTWVITPQQGLRGLQGVV